MLVTFDERNFDNTQSQPSVLNGFGGAENSTLVGASDGLPADGAKTGKSAKVVKNAGETYAGTSVQRKPNDAVPTTAFPADHEPRGGAGRAAAAGEFFHAHAAEQRRGV